jgi:hypothetical protein
VDPYWFNALMRGRVFRGARPATLDPTLPALLLSFKEFLWLWFSIPTKKKICSRCSHRPTGTKGYSLSASFGDWLPVPNQLWGS